MRLSKEKRDRISEQILSLLYDSFPKQWFGAEISKELARDEEFIKTLLLNLMDKGLLITIKKNSKGILFIRRARWQLSPKAFIAYKSRSN